MVHEMLRTGDVYCNSEREVVFAAVLPLLFWMVHTIRQLNEKVCDTEATLENQQRTYLLGMWKKTCRAHGYTELAIVVLMQTTVAAVGS